MNAVFPGTCGRIIFCYKPSRLDTNQTSWCEEDNFKAHGNTSVRRFVGRIIEKTVMKDDGGKRWRNKLTYILFYCV